jgi:hypothetical protein
VGAGEIADARDLGWRIVAMSAPQGEKKTVGNNTWITTKWAQNNTKKYTNLIDGVVHFNEDFY